MRSVSVRVYLCVGVFIDYSLADDLFCSVSISAREKNTVINYIRNYKRTLECSESPHS